MEDNTNASTATRAQIRKRKGGNLIENRPYRRSPLLNPTANQDKGLVPETLTVNAQPSNATPSTIKPPISTKTAGITWVQKAVHDAQAQAKKSRRKKRDSLWGRVAKAVDDAMEAESPEQIERHHIDHILKAILECALPKLPCIQKPSSSHQRKEEDKSGEERQEGHNMEPTAPSRTSSKTLANIAAKKGNSDIGKPTLASPLKGLRPDERLMVRLGKESPH